MSIVLSFVYYFFFFFLLLFLPTVIGIKVCNYWDGLVEIHFGQAFQLFSLFPPWMAAGTECGSLKISQRKLWTMQLFVSAHLVRKRHKLSDEVVCERLPFIAEWKKNQLSTFQIHRHCLHTLFETNRRIVEPVFTWLSIADRQIIMDLEIINE